ncbi:PAS domain-containing protein [Flavobacterium sp. W20_MBD1_R3]|uniref:PAS domain-containing protein n=1 Tax=Flavobacterium sp. W20_MBD1_R3 TaxID=3240278 RepID=UPI003F90EA1B
MWELDLMTFEAKFSNYWAGLLGYTIEEFEHSYDFWKNNVHRDDVMRVEKEFYDYILNYLETYEVVFRMKHKKRKLCLVKI